VHAAAIDLDLVGQQRATKRQSVLVEVRWLVRPDQPGH
jgi:hypothetical protein